MIYVTVGSLVFGVLGVAYGLVCYWKLWQWARQCQGARIVVAYKNKVKLNAPMVEWLVWANMLDKDKDHNGRNIYRMGGTDVAIVKRGFTAQSPMHELGTFLQQKLHLSHVTKKKTPAHKVQAPVRDMEM